MVQKMFSVRDQKAETFGVPFYKPTLGEAERDFITACNDDTTMFHRYPEDYDLYFMGEYDMNNGKFVPVDTPQHVCKAVQCVRSRETAQ